MEVGAFRDGLLRMSLKNNNENINFDWKEITHLFVAYK